MNYALHAQARAVQATRAPAVDFVKFAAALAANGNDVFAAAEQVKRFESPRLTSIMRAAVAAGSTIDPGWAAPLVDYNAMSGQFLTLMRSRSIIGQLQGFRRVAFATRTLRTGAGAAAGWVGQSKPKPVTRMEFDNVLLTHAKVVSFTVVTTESVRFWSATNGSAIQDEMLNSASFFEDQAFLDPSIAAVADVSPASITHGVIPVHSSGSTPDEIRADAQLALGQLIAAGSDLHNVAVIAHPRSALAMSLMRDSAGPAFPGVTAVGGEFCGLPMLTTNAMPLAGSPGLTALVFVDASRILLADEDLATVDSTTHAAVQMLDNPSTGAQQLFSLWQANCTGIRVEHFINWVAADGGAAAVIDQIAF